jgi:hypothetical protein
MKSIINLKQRSSIRIIILVVLVCVVSFLYWNNFVQVKNNNREGKTSTDSKQISSKSSTEPVDTENSKNNSEDRLVLSDWRVVFTMVPELRDTEVKYVQRNSPDNQTTYAFTTARIQALGGECTRQTFGDTIHLSRFTEKPRAVPDGELINENPIDGYYYALGGPLAGCSAVDENGAVVRQASPIEQKDAAALRKFVKTLVSAQ